MDSGIQVDRALGYFRAKNYIAANAAVALVLHADSRNLRALRLLADLRSAEGQTALGRRLRRWADQIESSGALPMETNGTATDADADSFGATAQADMFDADEHDPVEDGSAAHGTISDQPVTLSGQRSQPAYEDWTEPDLDFFALGEHEDAFYPDEHDPVAGPATHGAASEHSATLSGPRAQPADEDWAEPDLDFFATGAQADAFDPDELDPFGEEGASPQTPTPATAPRPGPRPRPRSRLELRLYAEQKALDILTQTGRLNDPDAELDHSEVLADIMLDRASWSDEPFRSIAAQASHMRNLLDRNINVSNLAAAHNCRVAWHVNTHFHVEVARISTGWHAAVDLSWLEALRFAELFKVSEVADAEHALQGIYEHWRCTRQLQCGFPTFRHYLSYRLQEAGWFLEMMPDQVFAEPEDAHWIETWEDDPVRRPLLVQYMDLRGVHNDDPYWD